ncbi:MAG: hypothetical protein U5L45_10425 [Saprospiraceae bacterium]|nr:hypothetical protein [Saprospiraceae bacterium]
MVHFSASPKNEPHSSARAKRADSTIEKKIWSSTLSNACYLFYRLG